MARRLTGSLGLWRRNESGAAAVEFAIVASVFITMVLGAFWMGWGLYCGADVRHGIERASRIFLSTPSATDDQFEQAVAANLQVTHLSDITFSISRPTISSAQVAQIAWNYDYTVQIPLMQPLVLHMGSQITEPIGVG